MNFEKIPNQAELTINDALTQIEAIKGAIAAMGANDSEFDSIQHICKELQNGKLTPVDAVNQVQGIQDSKSAYH